MNRGLQGEKFIRRLYGEEITRRRDYTEKRLHGEKIEQRLHGEENTWIEVYTETKREGIAQRED